MIKIDYIRKLKNGVRITKYPTKVPALTNNILVYIKMFNVLLIKTLVSFLKDKEYRDLLITTTIIRIFGSAAYHHLEGWSWVDSIYFSVITLTTIGYGDFSPQTDEGKIFTIFYILIGIGIILSFVNTVYNHYNSMKIKSKSKN